MREFIRSVFLTVGGSVTLMFLLAVAFWVLDTIRVAFADWRLRRQARKKSKEISTTNERTKSKMRIIEYIGVWGNRSIVNADKLRKAWVLINHEPTNPYSPKGEFRIVCNVDGEEHSFSLKRIKYDGPKEEKKAKRQINADFKDLTSFLTDPTCVRLDLT